MNDLISRDAALNALEALEQDAPSAKHASAIFDCEDIIKSLPSVESERKPEHCKNCKYFDYDSMANVDGIPLIVAHEICNKWGNGCKTSEDGYCFLYEPRESEE